MILENKRYNSKCGEFAIGLDNSSNRIGIERLLYATGKNRQFVRVKDMVGLKKFMAVCEILNVEVGFNRIEKRS